AGVSVTFILPVIPTGSTGGAAFLGPIPPRRPPAPFTCLAAASPPPPLPCAPRWLADPTDAAPAPLPQADAPSGLLSRTLEAIAALDFYPTEARSRAERALLETDAAVKQLLFTSSQTSLGAGERLLRRAWATRHPPWADRLACAWLIRRFVDPEATLAWLDKSEELPSGALGFAFDGAHFAASGTRVAYEEMLAQLQLAKNPALTKIGSIVHFLEMGGSTVPEAAGVQMLLQGAQRRSTSMQELLA